MNPILKKVVNGTPLHPTPIITMHDNRVDHLNHVNIEVQRVFNLIVVELRKIVAKLNYTQNRTYLLRNYPAIRNDDTVILEFTCVICEVRLYKKKGYYRIEYETDTDVTKFVGSHYRDALREIYRATMDENTHCPIEDRITIITNMANHYSYYKRKVLEASDEECLIDTEEPCRDWEQI